MEIYDSLMAIYDKIILCLHWLKFMTISQREAQIHSWTFLASLMIIFDHSQREAQNHSRIFMSSLIEIYDHSQREAQIHLWTFMASLIIIYDQKSAKRKTIYDHLWLHWWSFLTKKKRRAQNQYLIDIIFDKERPIQVKNSWVILNPGQKGFRGSRSQCPTINALGYRLCKSPNNKFRALFCSKVRVSWGDLPSAASPPTYATPIECALWYLQCAPTIASGLPLSIVPSVGIT